MSSTVSSTASATSSTAAASSSAASGSISGGSNLKIVGIILAITSGFLIGSSFVFKKKGLLRAQAGKTAGEGVAYLKSPLWWTGMTMMILGELCNFAAYAFVEAIVVTPLGALSVVICAILSSLFLNEKLTFFGWLGCGLCIVGSVIIALNGPSENSVGQIKQFQQLFLAPGFLAYGSVLIAVALAIIFYFAPRYGKKSMLWYIFVCSMIGGISVSVTTGLGSAIVTTAEGDNQFKYWFIYFLMAFVAVTLITEVYYLNVALALFNTAMVTPTYYVIFTFFSILTTIVLFQGLKASASSIITLVMGFVVICFGITILQMSKVDPQNLTKLDRRSTILLQASREHTAGIDEKDVLAVEDPGMDTLRGSFGTVGSIIRARSARRLSMSRGVGRAASSNSTPYDPPQGQPWLSPRNSAMSNTEYFGGLKRHQLYDAPVPLGSPSLTAATRGAGDDMSSIHSGGGRDSAMLPAKKPTIKFDTQDVVHQYHPTGTGGTRDDLGAIHEHRATATSTSPPPPIPPPPPPPPGISGLPTSSAADSYPSLSMTKTAAAATGAGPGASAGASGPRDLLSDSPPPTTAGLPQILSLPRSNDTGGLGGGRIDSRDVFARYNSNSSSYNSPSSPIVKERPSTATLMSFPSVTDSAWSRDSPPSISSSHLRTESSSAAGANAGRGKSARKYPKGDRDADREESVSLWQRDDKEDDSEGGESDPMDDAHRGGIRLVTSTPYSDRSEAGRGRF